MTIDIITIFPKMFKGPFDESIVKRAVDKALVKINIHDLRKWTTDKHKTVDDRPYGGGPGMIFMIQPIYDALESLKSKIKNQKSKIILLTPRGRQFNQKKAKDFAKLDRLILICGHYEGVDERVRKHLADEAISVGPYVLSGGEIAAMTITDTVVRLLPKALGNPNSLNEESFVEGFLEYPQYTRPANFSGWKVPPVLLSGDHQKIKKWRKLGSKKS